MRFASGWTRWLKGILALLAIGAMGAAQANPAQGDAPGRVGRIAETSGTVWIFDDGQGDWTQAQRNRPVTAGDRLSTGADGRIEVRIGSTTLRLAARSELELLRLDDERLQMQLHSGSAALRIRSREVADETEFSTPEARFKPQRAGHYRFDRQDDTTFAASLLGELLLDGPVSFPIATGTRMEFWRERGRQGVQHRWAALPQDELASWLAREEQQEQRSASSRYVSPEMTGAEELDRYGRWDRHPEYGAIWVPLSVSVGWAPYRNGNWIWMRPWGWTWVDHQPWGFAPFHYGRWVNWRGNWCWTPGGYVARPAFSPGLVAWIGGPSVSVGISLRGRHLPGSSWVPLAPHDHYQPHYRRGPQPSPSHPSPHPRHDRQVPTGPIMYGNQGVPNAVTPVSRDVLVPRVGNVPQSTAPVAPPVARIREPAPARIEPMPVMPVPAARPAAALPVPAAAPMAPAAAPMAPAAPVAGPVPARPPRASPPSLRADPPPVAAPPAPPTAPVARQQRGDRDQREEREAREAPRMRTPESRANMRERHSTQ